MDDDTDTRAFFPLSGFALGSVRSGGVGGASEADARAACTGADPSLAQSTFLRGFGSATTHGTHSRLSVNLARGWVYVYAVPDAVARTPGALLPLEAEIPFDVS